jgi:hypothetical protein
VQRAGGAWAEERFNLTYEPVTSRLLFHEKTTLRVVLDDVVVKMREQIAAYFAAHQEEEDAELARAEGDAAKAVLVRTTARSQG